ncbi:MAG: ABC transporter ATP-binding protein [Deltaproteobacteria bacterium]|jgi:ABC-type branched-subunit amino acid transport system ATPase component|nr:ABC transporter ATP-binding protein [Deltaproteobacteria bacterium]
MLEVRNIDAAYGHARVLQGVSFNIEKGQMAFFIGRNGAGKTTLLKTIMGLLQPRNGSITYEGKEITGTPPEELYRRGMRYVGQEKKVFGNLTVRENIELAAYASQEPLDRALEKVLAIYPKLKDFLRIRAGQLSGGQRQILLVGRALVGEPKLLLIDEPTQGLAAVVIEEIGKILTALKDRVSAAIVEQNLAIVKHLADRVYILKEGKVAREIVEKAGIADTQGMEEYL